MVAHLKRFIPFIAGFLLIFFTAAIFYMFGNLDKAEPAEASTKGETAESEGNGGDADISNIIDNNINGSNVTSDNAISNNIISKNSDTDDSGSVVNNQIDNDINGENADLENNIVNDIKGGSNNQLENNITNNIEVKVDVNVTNNITNNVDGSKKSKDDSEEKGNGNGDNNGNGENDNGTDTNGDENGEGTNGEVPDTVWGVDSASLTTEDMLMCVRDHFGDPQVWGRYLGDKEGVSYGLTQEEVELLHSEDIQILVIWNHFEDATSYEKGQSEAQAAIEMAEDFGIPEEVALFANVEPIYPIDSGFLLGWYETLAESPYESGVYGIFDPSEELYIAYETAAEENSDLMENNWVWTAAPNVGITTEENAPEYNPEAPEGSLIAGWQYGIDAETCNIDTVHYNGDALEVFW